MVIDVSSATIFNKFKATVSLVLQLCEPEATYFLRNSVTPSWVDGP